MPYFIEATAPGRLCWSRLALVLGLRPGTVRLEERDQAVIGLLLGHVLLDALLTDVQVDLARRAADVPKIGVRHLARPVHDAAHDRDFHTGQVAGYRLDPVRHRL